MAEDTFDAGTLPEINVHAPEPAPKPAPQAAPAPARPLLRPDQEDLIIKVDGKILQGWVACRVERGIERLPSGFAIDLSEFYPGQPNQAVVPPGAKVEVYLGADLILTGYADMYFPDIERDRHPVVAEGRSKTEDLVDCSLTKENGVLPPWWIAGGSSIRDYVRLICKPFGIDFVCPDVSLPVGDNFPINPGETCYQLIEQMARATQLLVWDDPQGRLVLSKVGTQKAATQLVEGVNCELAGARLSMDQRYSQIQVVAQVATDPKLSPNGQANYPVWYTATDTSQPAMRFRPLLLIMDVPGPGGSNLWAKQQADWEMARRYARSRVVQVRVTGWRCQDGRLWTPNTLVGLKLPSVKISEDMLLVHCAWLRDARGGTGTLLTLMPPAGFEPEPFHFVGPLPELHQPSAGGE